MHAAAAAEEGGFNRPDIHFSRIYGRIDEAGWSALSDLLRKTLGEVEQIVADSEKRTKSAERDPQGTTVILMHFAGPTSDPAAEGAPMDRVLQTSAAAIHAGQPIPHAAEDAPEGGDDTAGDEAQG
jgi:hypothetical protein